MEFPPMNTLRAFEAAARLSSLTLAGEELNLTHAAIGHQVKHLEQWLGRKVFQRSGRGIALTPTGLEFYRAVSNALTSLSVAASTLRRKPNRKSITVGCIPSIAVGWLVPKLPEFLGTHPHVALHVVYARADEQHQPETFDALITLREHKTHDVTSTKLFSRVNKPVASPHYLATHGPLKTPKALLKANLLHDDSEDAWRGWFLAAGVHVTAQLRGPVFQDFHLLSTAAIAGHGVALCPVEVFRREIARGDLVVLSEVSTMADNSYFLVTATQASHAVVEFRDWFVEVCRRA
jgi:LysR family glycine cleavage system transcriptional activator